MGGGRGWRIRGEGSGPLFITDAWRLSFFADECVNKYGNANAWKYCARVFDYLTLAAVCVFLKNRSSLWTKRAGLVHCGRIRSFV